MSWLRRAGVAALVGLVRLYQLVPKGAAPRCRFLPSCSQYAVDAIQTRGPVTGCWLAGRRLLRCHPWNPGGIDHVPPPAGRERARQGAA